MLCGLFLRDTILRRNRDGHRNRIAQLSLLTPCLIILMIILPTVLANFGDVVQRFQQFHLGVGIHCLVSVWLRNLPHIYHIHKTTGKLSVSGVMEV